MKGGEHVGCYSQAVSLITCRFLGADGKGDAINAIRCVDYCIGKDAHIVSSFATQVALADPEAHSLLIPELQCTGLLEAARVAIHVAHCLPALSLIMLARLQPGLAACGLAWGTL